MIERHLAELKAQLTTSKIVKRITILDEFTTDFSGFIDSKVNIIDGSILYVTEYIKFVEGRIKRDKYSFHWQRDNRLIFRYDNSPHYKDIKTFPHHKHIGMNNVICSKEMSLSDTIDEIELIILDGKKI